MLGTYIVAIGCHLMPNAPTTLWRKHNAMKSVEKYNNINNLLTSKTNYNVSYIYVYF